MSIDINNTSVDDFIRLKIKAAEEIIREKLKEVSSLKKMLAAKENTDENNIDEISEDDVEGENLNPLSEGFVPTQKTVKPFVIALLKKHGPKMDFTSAGVFNHFKEIYKIPQEKRQDWMLAISLSFNNLVSGNKVQAKDGDGRGKIYSLVEE